MKILADVGVNWRVAEWLRSEEHDVSHLSEEGLHTLSDREVFAKASNEGRAILTFDLDFSEIAAQSRERTVSVIVLRLANARPQHVRDRLAAVLPKVETVVERGAVISVEEHRYRVRPLPVGSEDPSGGPPGEGTE